MKHKIKWPEDRKYKYWAMDKGGEAYFYKDTPQLKSMSWVRGYYDNYKSYFDNTFKNNEGLNWKESLICRDDVENLTAHGNFGMNEATLRDQYKMAALTGLLIGYKVPQGKYVKAYEYKRERASIIATCNAIVDEMMEGDNP